MPAHLIKKYFVNLMIVMVASTIDLISGIPKLVPHNLYNIECGVDNSSAAQIVSAVRHNLDDVSTT
jgi:hypothetical protein